jgi:hypothetical protein
MFKILIEGVFKMKKLNQTLLSLAVIVAVVMLALPTGTVAAQAEDPQLGEDRPAEEPKGLDGWYAELVDRYEQAGERIGNADEAADRLAQRIETLTEAGLDPVRLQAILDDFQANMDAVQAAYDDLGEVIDEHAGFDADGQVTDEGLALGTLRQIADGLLDLHQASEDARFELRWDLRVFQYQNR